MSHQSRVVLLVSAAVLSIVAVAMGDDPAPGQTTAAQVKTGRFVYKSKPRRTLDVYYPDDWKSTDRRSALIIFRCNIPVQREHFRKLGMVIIKPQLASVNSGRLPSLSLDEIAKLPRPRHQVEDTKSAIRFVRKNSAKLGIDAQRIVATGTSGGGDLALQAHLNRSFENPRDDRAISPSPDALVLYCPAFDGIDIWFVKMDTIVRRTKNEAPAFLSLLTHFIKNTTDQYATPLNHRADLIAKAAKLGKDNGIDEAEIARFQNILREFNERDWQLLHPVEDAQRMSASRILTADPLPPTLIMFGDRDHLVQHQKAFVANARAKGQEFELQIIKGGGHSFMMQPAFQDSSTRIVEKFLGKMEFLPSSQ